MSPELLATVVAVALLLVERLTHQKGIVKDLFELVAQERQSSQDLVNEFARERGELLLRIQHPGVIVPPRIEADPAQVAEEEEDEFELIGTVAPPPEPEDLGPDEAIS